MSLQSQPQGEPRFKKRVSCRISLGGRAYSGMVLNFSRGGLFVQSSAGARPGEEVRLDLNVDREQAIRLGGSVIWRRNVAAHLRTISQEGFGLRIQRASETYYSFLSTVARVQPALEREEPPARAAAGPALRYRVRVQQSGGPRTRTLLLEGASEPEARQRALDSAGPGWLVLEVERLGGA